MVVSTHEVKQTTFYSPRITNLKRRIYLKARSRLPTEIGGKADFVVGNTSGGSFRIVEIKKSAKTRSGREIPSYSRGLVIARDHFLLGSEIIIRKQEVRGGIETLPELVQVARRIEISYHDKASLEALLGSKGRYVLAQVLAVVKELVHKRNRPLDRIKVRYVRDPEVKDWEYVLVQLMFICDFNTADSYLHELYNEVDKLTNRLNAEEREILQRMIFFDIETAVSILSS